MKTTETEVLLLLTAAQLLIAADKAPGSLRKNLQRRGEELLEEAAETRADEAHKSEPTPFKLSEPAFTQELLGEFPRTDDEHFAALNVEVDRSEPGPGTASELPFGDSHLHV